MVVGLDLQHVGHAIAEVVIEVATGTELLVGRIEELAAEALVGDLAVDRVQARLCEREVADRVVAQAREVTRDLGGEEGQALLEAGAVEP